MDAVEMGDSNNKNMDMDMDMDTSLASNYNTDPYYQQYTYTTTYTTIHSQWHQHSSTSSLYNKSIAHTAKLENINTNTEERLYNEPNFVKAVKFSPDGGLVLASLNDHVLRVFECPQSQSNNPQLAPYKHFPEGESIYDMVWYPHASTTDPITCTFLSSTRDHPIHLWGVHTGLIRSSYTCLVNTETIVAPHSLLFSSDGDKIFAGCEASIHCFDTSRPGPEPITVFKTSPTRKSRQGQKGIISCLALNPDRSGLVLAGTYYGGNGAASIGLYDARLEECFGILKSPFRNSVNGVDTRFNGVTQIVFSSDGKYFVSAHRGTGTKELLVWDLRNTGDVVAKLERGGDNNTTNQRIQMDVMRSSSLDKDWIMTGDMDGNVNVFDLTKAIQVGVDVDSGEVRSSSMIPVVKPEMKYVVAEDVVGGMGISPWTFMDEEGVAEQNDSSRRENVWVVTGSGSRRLDERADLMIISDDEDSDDEDDDNTDNEEEQIATKKPQWDCQIKFWKVPVDVTYHHHPQQQQQQ